MKLLYALLILAAFIPIECSSVEPSGRQESPQLHSQFNNISLNDALKEISQQTGYIFHIPEEWGSVKVLGTFSLTDPDTFFRRALKGYNFILIFDDLTKTIIVKDFGSPSGTNFTAIAAEGIGFSGGIIDPESGMLKEELQKLHAQQLKELKLLESDLDAIDFMSGLTNRALQKLHKQQIALQKQEIQAGSAIDPMSGLTTRVLQELYEQQILEQVGNLQNGSAIEPMSGLTTRKLQELYEEQIAERKEAIENGSAIDFMSGMPIVNSK